ncbi:MAG: hypothetical protein LBQ63_03070 [Deltaproteobacteria bacterium]|nr:hypothetical protein [Deltaproteobacteria bacterium]
MMNENTSAAAGSPPEGLTMSGELTMPEELLGWLRDDGLPLPPLPRELAAILEEVDEYVFQASSGSEKSLRLGFSGHGIQSWRFGYRLAWPGLRFSLDLPYASAYGNLEEDKARLEEGFDLALLCLTAADNGLSVSGWERAFLEVEYDEDFCRYRCANPSGETLDEGDSLDKLLDILQMSIPSLATDKGDLNLIPV